MLFDSKSKIYALIQELENNIDSNCFYILII